VGEPPSVLWCLLVAGLARPVSGRGEDPEASPLETRLQVGRAAAPGWIRALGSMEPAPTGSAKRGRSGLMKRGTSGRPSLAENLLEDLVAVGSWCQHLAGVPAGVRLAPRDRGRSGRHLEFQGLSRATFP
jgi:hypothetical protein